ncbi:MAG: aspartyl protease family protein [Sphingomonadales bacterium]|jgi:predicted aspartyl protease
MRAMSVIALLVALATSVPAPGPVAAGSPVIPLASIDNSLEIKGDAIDAEALKKRMFIDVKVNDAGPYRFLVDSGADRSVISSGVAGVLALPTTGTARLQSMAGQASVNLAEVDRLVLGRSEVGPLTTPVLAARDMGADGVIGIDALADQRLLLDFVKRTVTVQDSRTKEPLMTGEILVTAKRRKGQLIITEASVRGRGVSAVIDTGSEVTTGNMALRRALFGNRVPAGMQTITLVSVTGQTLAAEAILLNDIRVGGVIMNNVAIAFVDAPPFELFGLANTPAIFLGSDLLNSFRRVGLDFRNRKVRFTLR